MRLLQNDFEELVSAGIISSDTAEHMPRKVFDGDAVIENVFVNDKPLAH